MNIVSTGYDTIIVFMFPVTQDGMMMRKYFVFDIPDKSIHNKHGTLWMFTITKEEMMIDKTADSAFSAWESYAVNVIARELAAWRYLLVPRPGWVLIHWYLTASPPM